MSKQIYDCLGLLDEVLLCLTESAKLFPVPCSRATLERWVRRGVRGVRLETVRIGNRRFTSEQAIRRFLVAQQQTIPEQARVAPKRATMSAREIEAAARRFSLPNPQGVDNFKTTNKKGD